MQTQVFVESYYMNRVQVTINSVIPEQKLTEVPDSVKESIINNICEEGKSGTFGYEDCRQLISREKDMWEKYSGSWRVIELDYEFLRMISLWKNTHSQDEALTEDLFIKYFGVIDGKHFYGKWMYSFKRDLMEMISYFGRETTKGQIFCDMVMNQVNKYKKRKK